MGFTASQVLDFVRDNDVKFVRLAFCDLFGAQKNVSIMAGELPQAFERGICVDTAAVRGFIGGNDYDIFLIPDPATLSTLPWRSSHGGLVQLFCDLYYVDGAPYPGDGRSLLRKAVSRATAMGFACQIGCECEFYLFHLDEKGEPTLRPNDQAGYCDIGPNDRGENIRREICTTLQSMGIQPESSHHERGPGQNEIVCKYTGAMEAADALVSFQAVAQTVAARNGLYASFHPKPLAGRDGNSVHLNISLTRGGVNLFRSGSDHCAEAESFLAGLLRELPDLSAFLNPLPGSYDRLEDDVPRALTWSHQNRNQLVRIPASSGDYTRIELRSPDPMLSPYLAFALLLEAGLDGIDQGLPLDRERQSMELGRLPVDLKEAVERARRSELVSRVIPAEALETYCNQKLLEYNGQA